MLTEVGMGNLLMISAVIAGIIYVDHNSYEGNLFPDDFYCAIGAGITIRQGSVTEPTQWSYELQGGQMQRYPSQYTTYPGREQCIHGSIWDAISKKLA